MSERKQPNPIPDGAIKPPPPPAPPAKRGDDITPERCVALWIEVNPGARVVPPSLYLLAFARAIKETT